MNYWKITNALLSFFLMSCFSFGQDSLAVEIASMNAKIFTFSEETFKGAGWDYIREEVSKASNVLIGEVHASNEIPLFTKSVFNCSKFDNFYIEVDPYSTRIIENAIKNFTPAEQVQFYADYKDLFSFYSLQAEFELLEHIVKAQTNILGADQIVAYADRLLFQDLLLKTKNSDAKKIYTNVVKQSQLHLEEFFKDPKKPMYFMTEVFKAELKQLEALPLSAEEEMIVRDMQKSIVIYQPGGHKKRIQLIKHYLMEAYPKWNRSKNLFKYGAMHMARGESFLTVYDIGNMVANIAESNFETSFHLMIVGESGMKGAPFRSFPPSEVNIERGLLQSLKIFFDITAEENWYVFNLRPIREQIDKGNLKIEDLVLHRLIKGYDALVIIPELTPAKFSD